MGTIVIILAAIIEITLGVYCIATKSNQRKTRSLVRIGTFSAFIIFILTPVLEWSFRWMLLALILLIWSVIGAITLIKNKEDKKVYRTSRTVLKGISMWLIVIIAVTPALIFPQFRLPEPTGKYNIGTAIYTCTDKSRMDTFSKTGNYREVTFEFWYPRNAQGRYPLVVFSHGAFGVMTSNTSTFRELASNGYVVCSIGHPHHSLLVKDVNGKLTTVDSSFMKEVTDVNNGVYDNKTAFEIEKKWLTVRTDDINFVLDTIKKNASDNNSDKVYKLVDTNKIGLIGHSLGGAAVAKLGRDRNDIGAVVNLDGDLLGECIGVVDGKYIANHKVYPVPLFSIYTDTMKNLFDSADANLENPQKLILSTAPNSFEVFIKGTNHMSLTDLPLQSPFLVNLLEHSNKKSGGSNEADKHYVINSMNHLVLEFFDSYLKGKGTFHPAVTY